MSLVHSQNGDYAGVSRRLEGGRRALLSSGIIKVNNDLYAQYKKLAQTVPQVIFGGRLGQYRYYDMHQVIAAALETVKHEFE